MQICNGIIQFNSIQNANYTYEINTAEIKKHPKTLKKRLGLKQEADRYRLQARFLTKSCVNEKVNRLKF